MGSERAVADRRQTLGGLTGSCGPLIVALEVLLVPPRRVRSDYVALVDLVVAPALPAFARRRSNCVFARVPCSYP